MIESDDTLEAMRGIERLLRLEIGLDASTVGSSLVERGVRRRMAKRGTISMATYAGTLAGDVHELQELVEEVVVPETYFFREPEAIAAVARRATAMPLRPSADKPLRILSVPCSSGEEPFSIAMALLMAGIFAEAFAIDAVDLSLEAIKRARFGAFRESSFRGEVGAWKDFFRESARGWEIDDGIRDTVRVAHGNIVSPAFQPPHDRYDVIFCRNLLIYFDVDTQARALANITSLLAPDGILVVGSADSFAVRRAGFEPLPGDERTFLFRIARPEVAIEQAENTRRRSAPAAHRLTTRPLRIAAKSAGREMRRAVLQPLPPPAERRETRLASALARIASFANEGRLADAIAEGEEALREGLASAEILATMGTTLAAIPDLAGAERCYRRALFLDPNNEDALLHLSHLLEQRGERALASRLRARAQRTHAPAGGQAT